MNCLAAISNSRVSYLRSQKKKKNLKNDRCYCSRSGMWRPVSNSSVSRLFLQYKNVESLELFFIKLCSQLWMASFSWSVAALSSNIISFFVVVGPEQHCVFQVRFRQRVTRRERYSRRAVLLLVPCYEHEHSISFFFAGSNIMLEEGGGGGKGGGQTDRQTREERK